MYAWMYAYYAYMYVYIYTCMHVYIYTHTHTHRHTNTHAYYDKLRQAGALAAYARQPIHMLLLLPQLGYTHSEVKLQENIMLDASVSQCTHSDI
jgi:hypothetical protein